MSKPIIENTVRLADLLSEVTSKEEDARLLAAELARIARDCYDDVDVPTDVDGARAYVTSVSYELSQEPVREDATWVVVPTPILEEPGLEPNQFSVRCVADLYMTSDLKKVKMSSWNGEGEIPTIVPYGFDFAAWEVIANHRVAGIDDICERQRMEFLADVIWETTLFGPTKEIAEARSGAMMDNLEEQIEEYFEARSTSSEDELTHPFDPHAELEKLIGKYDLAYNDAVDEFMRTAFDALARKNAKRLADICRRIGI